MFTDIQGFSERAQRDEDAAIWLLRAHDRILKECIRRNHGDVVKQMGDAFLGRFSAASDAIDCAIEVQERLARWNRSRSRREQLMVRVGVHVGDVVLARKDIIGVVANLGKRLESAAPVREVCCTDAARLMVAHLPRYRFRLLRRTKPRGSHRQMAFYVVTAATRRRN